MDANGNSLFFAVLSIAVSHPMLYGKTVLPSYLPVLQGSSRLFPQRSPLFFVVAHIMSGKRMPLGDAGTLLQIFIQQPPVVIFLATEPVRIRSVLPAPGSDLHDAVLSGKTDVVIFVCTEEGISFLSKFLSGEVPYHRQRQSDRRRRFAVILFPIGGTI